MRSKKWLSILMVLLGNVIYALTVKLFVLPSNLISCGTTGLALVVLFFLCGVVKTCGSLAELKRPEVAVKMLVRFCLAKALVTYGLEIMMALLNIVQGINGRILAAAGFIKPSPTFLPPLWQ